VVSLLHSEIIARKATVNFPQTGERLLVGAGRVEVQQVLLNLVLNALDAVTADGAADGRCIDIASALRDGWVSVSVRDNGPGIPESMRSRLFDPFASTKPGGLGLGLAISRRIAHSLGGSLIADNHPEGGAVFLLSLPAAAGEDNALPEPPDLS
jgi:C4-dicarboxylate-specific signal transduction histidine kinase